MVMERLNEILKSKKPLTYKLLTQPQPGEISAAIMEVFIARNGLFVRGRREGLEAAIPLAQGQVPGRLYEFSPYLKLDYPRLGPALMEEMLRLAREARDPAQGYPVEILFYLWWSYQKKGWHLELPPQEQKPGSVRPILDEGEGNALAAYRRTLIEIHSHPLGYARFSATDDRDERTGFRIFGCLADIFGKPHIRFRVGLYGYLWEFPAALICEPGPNIKDAVVEEEAITLNEGTGDGEERS